MKCLFFVLLSISAFGQDFVMEKYFPLEENYSWTITDDNICVKYNVLPVKEIIENEAYIKCEITNSLGCVDYCYYSWSDEGLYIGTFDKRGKFNRKLLIPDFSKGKTKDETRLGVVREVVSYSAKLKTPSKKHENLLAIKQYHKYSVDSYSISYYKENIGLIAIETSKDGVVYYKGNKCRFEGIKKENISFTTNYPGAEILIFAKYNGKSVQLVARKYKHLTPTKIELPKNNSIEYSFSLVYNKCNNGISSNNLKERTSSIDRNKSLQLKYENNRQSLPSSIRVNFAKSCYYKNSIHPRDISNSKEVSRMPLGSGTGFILSLNGYVATNYHVVHKANAIKLIFPKDDNSFVEYEAVVQLQDVENDIAILKIKNNENFKGISTIPYLFEPNANIGQKVFTIGYPFPDIMGSDYKYTEGSISSNLSSNFDNVPKYQISTPIQPGNSGGPLFNNDGNVIGITSSSLNPFYVAKIGNTLPQNVNYAISINQLLNILPDDLKPPEKNSIKDLSRENKITKLKNYSCKILVY